MSDDLGLFTDDAGEPPRSRKEARQRRERLRRRKRRGSVTAMAGVCVLLLVGVGVVYGAMQILRIGSYEDYEGQGSGEVVVEVSSGDTVSNVAQTLSKADVVASSSAFTNAAEENRQINNVQPGFYLMKSRMSGAAAVQRMLSPEAKTGRVEVRGGQRLEDQLSPDGGSTPGLLTKLAQATCTDAAKQCTTPEQMHQAAASADLAALGVPEWAIADAQKAPPERRLEGLIMPGVYDVKPGEPPEEVLRQVVTKSAALLQAAGLPQAADGTGHTPYELLTIGSLVQSEGIQDDFGKVARVIYNRTTDPQMKLQMDSTINYPLDKPTLLTKSEDRQKPGPYNSYQNFGLPPTPISTVSKAALQAAEKPDEGTWVYFVKCFPDGHSCFATTQAEHDRYIQEAQQRGAF
ncbi:MULTISPECIES: endolytic transglycosylase MltG [unclassified Saccharopolyspora]|uniref:endolytic transglycosylase MltG n=1 Tax=Saccharopolyspora TaxID=1835 RepID=UPI00190C5043|nr:endolytic transglycosylase MltG [Saccharopolyspora sp. HNM0986]MBK0867144.1 endolytic transglycosylase MltG [Saccharopolyspora sp. HNM0986]